MYLGEMALLVTAVLVMSGAVKGITSRLGFNDYIATFTIFVIALTAVRGGIRLNDRFELSLGGILSLVVAIYTLVKRSEKASDFLLALLSALGCAGIVFAYSVHFSEAFPLDPRLLATLLSLLVGLWCAFSARRTFSACLFSALTGGYVGSAIYLIFFRMSGNIGGSYSFAVMWLGAIFGLMIQYVLTVMLRAIKSPRADCYFEAGAMNDEEKEEEKRR